MNSKSQKNKTRRDDPSQSKVANDIALLSTIDLGN